MLKKEASQIVGGLSKPGKMPCYSINLPATECKTGAKLARVPGTVCYDCYPLKNRYRMPVQQNAMGRRLGALLHPLWVQAMTALITGHKYFRWHDSATCNQSSISRTYSKFVNRHQAPVTGCQRVSMACWP